MTLSKPATSEPKEVLVEHRVWPSAKQSFGDRQPTLFISFEALERLLNEESSIISIRNVGHLLAALGYRAKDGNSSDKKALADWIKRAEHLVEADEDEAEE